jgi:hypothetical protein
MKKIYMLFALAFGLLSVSPAFAMAQTQNTYEQAVPYGNMMYGTAGTQVKGMPAFQTQNGQGEITFQSPNIMKFRTFDSYHFRPLHMLVCGITILMLWILMALAIVWLATHLKKNLHK